MSDIKDRVYQSLLSELERKIQSFWRSDYAEKCGSEIEIAFAAAFINMMAIRHVGVTFSRDVCIRDDVSLFLEPQYQIGDYRADFLLGSKHGATDLRKCIVIECDGHDFHDKTKEQAARDKARDRALSASVGRVLRFTGSEIYRDPAKCADEAQKVMWIAMLGWDPAAGEE